MISPSSATIPQSIERLRLSRWAAELVGALWRPTRRTVSGCPHLEALVSVFSSWSDAEAYSDLRVFWKQCCWSMSCLRLSKTAKSYRTRMVVLVVSSSQSRMSGGCTACGALHPCAILLNAASYQCRLGRQCLLVEVSTASQATDWLQSLGLGF